VTDLCSGSDEPLRLDLTDLVSADQAGLEALRALAHLGVALEGVSPYLAIRLGIDPAVELRRPAEAPALLQPHTGRKTGPARKEKR
jgi:hypothetical protein